MHNQIVNYLFDAVSDYLLRFSFIVGVFVVVSPALLILIYSAPQELKVDLANLFVQIILAFSASMAFVTYYENKREKQLKLAVELISFFREKILSKQNEISNLIFDQKGKEYVVPKIINFDVTILTQDSLFKTLEEKRAYLEFLKISSIEIPQTNLLNSMEEFALRIRTYKLTNISALRSVYAAFVQIVEQGGIHRIMQHRVIGTEEYVFSETLMLYDIWKHNISRKSETLRIKEYFGDLN